MSRFFSSSSPVMITLSKIFDMFFLSLLYLVFCVPVVTIGAATTSLYYVSIKVVRRGRSYVWREFWSSFKMNFGQSTVCWMILLLIYVLLYININLMGLTDENSTQYGGYLSGAYLAMMILVTCIGVYIFPIISRFKMKFTMVVRFSMFCAFRHILHTLLLLAILVGAAFLVYFGVGTSLVVLVAFVPGLTGFLCSFPIEHLMKKYMPKGEQKKDSDGNIIKQWYEE